MTATVTTLLSRLFRFLLIATLLAMAIPTWRHLEHGASVEETAVALFVDYQVVAACSEKGLDLWRFIDRSEVDLSVERARQAVCMEGAYAAEEQGGTSVPLARLQLWREHMLGLINDDRAASGLRPVVLGNNAAAQRHAEDLFQYKYLSHWGRDGLKPYMRYTLAGGTGYAAENVSGAACPKDFNIDYRQTPVLQSLEDAQGGLMDSPGHRTNILNPWHTRVNLGITCDDVGCSLVQLFEGDYVDFVRLPTLFGGALRVSGQMRGGFELSGIQVWYDQPPHPLTAGQLGRTFAYSVGQKPAVFLRPPPARGYHYTSDETEYTWSRGIDPYEVPLDTAPPARVMKGDISTCTDWPRTEFQQTALVPMVTADRWEAAGAAFDVEADLRSVLERLGPGVYTVVLWGERDGEAVDLTNYSLFVR